MANPRLTFPPRAGVVSDTVHGYVTLSPLERVILDQPVAQRLRYVAQNGLAQLVYPSSVTSRFSHSLGTMHLASKFLAATVRNSRPDAIAQLQQGIRDYARQRGFSANAIGRMAPSVDSDALLVPRLVGDADRRWWVFAEQSLRLAALFHDLGHLPFSHDFEHALRESWRKSSVQARESSPLRPLFIKPEEPPHESIGHQLAPRLLRSVASTHRVTSPKALSVTFELAGDILEATLDSPVGPAAATTRLLHILIDGDVDADRCDYILRDGRAYGFDFAGYDLTRLLDNLAVVARPEEEVGRPQLDVVVRSQGLSSVESFLIARFRSYQYGTRHHKVAQVGASLQHCIERLLMAPPASLKHDVSHFRAVIADVFSADTSLEFDRRVLQSFAECDDMWCMRLLRAACSDAPEDQWLGLVCWRRPGPVSLWKRPSDFPADLPVWNESLNRSRDLEAAAHWDTAVAELLADGVLVLRHRFWPLGKTPERRDRLQVLDSAGLVDVSKASPLLGALEGAWMEDVQVHAARTRESKVTAAEVIDRLSWPAR